MRADAEQRTRRGRTAPRRPEQGRIGDALVLTALHAIGLLSLDSLFSGGLWLLAGLGALGAGTGLALIGVRRGWGPLRMLGGLLLLQLTVGSLLGAPDRVLHGGMPMLSDLIAMLRAPVDAWSWMLSLPAPLGIEHGALGAIWMMMLWLPQAPLWLVLRTRHVLAAWILSLLPLATGIALGAGSALHPGARGILCAVLSLGWLAVRGHGPGPEHPGHGAIREAPAEAAGRGSRARSGAVIILVLTLCGATAAGAAPLLVPDDDPARIVPRDRMALAAVAQDGFSPLARVRRERTARADAPLFAVRGAAPGQRLRWSVADRYDGRALTTTAGEGSAAARRVLIGGQSSERKEGASGGPGAEAGGPSVRVEITVLTGGDRAVPVADGQLGGISVRGPMAPRSELFLDGSSMTLLAPEGTSTGEVLEQTVEPTPWPHAADLTALEASDIALPELPPMDPAVRAAALELLGSGSDGERTQRLADAISLRAVRSEGAPGQPDAMPGHEQRRLLDLLALLQQPSAVMAGDDAQLAALTVVLARSAGLPARVVVGYRIPAPGEAQSPAGATAEEVVVRGRDATAWVEVAMDGAGWVPFDPSPGAAVVRLLGGGCAAAAAIAHAPTGASTARPGTAAGTTPAAGAQDQTAGPFPHHGLGAAAPHEVLALLGIALGAGVSAAGVHRSLAPGLRRVRRRHRGGTPDRVAGAWEDVLEHAHRLGLAPVAGRTRSQVAAEIATALVDAGSASGPRASETAGSAGRRRGRDPRDGASARSALEALARAADRAVFSPEPVGETEVAAAWALARTARRAMSDAAPRHRGPAAGRTRHHRRTARSPRGDMHRWG